MKNTQCELLVRSWLDHHQKPSEQSGQGLEHALQQVKSRIGAARTRSYFSQLLTSARSPNRRQAGAAILAMCRVGVSSIRRALREDSNAAVRMQCAIALRSFPARETLRQLRGSMMADHNKAVRYWSADSIAYICDIDLEGVPPEERVQFVDQVLRGETR